MCTIPFYFHCVIEIVNDREYSPISPTSLLVKFTRVDMSVYELCLSTPINGSCETECMHAYINANCSVNLMDKFYFSAYVYFYSIMWTTMSLFVATCAGIGLVHFIAIDKRGTKWSSMAVTAVYVCVLLSGLFRGLHSLDIFSFYQIYSQFFQWFCFWFGQTFFYTAMVFVIAAWYEFFVFGFANR